MTAIAGASLLLTQACLAVTSMGNLYGDTFIYIISPEEKY
jgi:hypothetical protein